MLLDDGTIYICLFHTLDPRHVRTVGEFELKLG
jgi:hypothetical protein